MRFLPVLLGAGLIAGCAGHVADYVGPRADIVAPQLPRYGLDAAQTRCVSERLAASLAPLQLRLFERAAGSVVTGYFDPARLTVRDLMHVAGSMNDLAVPRALARANDDCGVAASAEPVREASSEPIVASEAEAAAAAPAPALWLNLGAAGSGQSIAIDASTIEQQASSRKAWFRLTDPGAQPSPDTYLLQVDCAARTINPLARRRLDAAGAVAEHVDYPPNPLPAEGGTVMEIAWLALCT